MATEELGDEELTEIREHFDQCDTDGDRRIDFAEFSTLLENLDAQMGPEERRIGFLEIDVDHDGAIDFEEFLAWWSEE